MTTVVRIKRRAANDPLGPGAPAPGTLMNAELAFNEVDNTLYYGSGEDANGNATAIIPIGGDGAGLPEAPSDTVTYGRKDVDWEPVLPLAGGAMTGLLTIDSVAGVAGTDGGTTAAGGNVDINAGDGTAGGRVRVYAGDGTTSGGGSVSVRGGQGTIGGGATLAAGKSTGVGNVGGNAAVTGGFVDTGTGGNVTITSGSASVSGNSGNVVLDTGTAIGGVRGDIRILNLSKTAPDTVADPMKVDTVWNNNGVLNIGAGAAPIDLSAYVLKAGDTMAGVLTLAADPANPLEAATMSYVDAGDAALQSQVDLLASNLLFTGSIDVVADAGAYTTASGMTDGPLPAAGATNTNFYVIVTTGGTAAAGNIPAGTYATGDWIVSDGTAWIQMPIGQPTGSVSEAPVDTFTYGRKDAAWAQAMPLVGGAPPPVVGGVGTNVVITGGTGDVGGGEVHLFGANSALYPAGDVEIKGGSFTAGVDSYPGSVRITGGDAAAGSGDGGGGGVILTGGKGEQDASGSIWLYGGAGNLNSPGGVVNLYAGDGRVGGGISIVAGGGINGNGGLLRLQSGGTSTFQAGHIEIFAAGASKASGFCGNVDIKAGSHLIPGSLGGHVLIEAGTAISGGTPGDIRLLGLPTIAPDTIADPAAVSTVWNNNGVLNIGAGITALPFDLPSGTEAPIERRVGGLMRWRVALGNNTPETPEGQGTDFTISRFANNGDPIDSVINISRQSGVVDFKFPPTVEGAPLGGGGDFLPLTGGTLTGALQLPAAVANAAVLPTQAINRQQLDWLIAPPLDGLGGGADVRMTASDATGVLTAGAVYINGGESPAGIGGYITLQAGGGGLIPGALQLYGAPGVGALNAGGPVYIYAGSGTGNGGGVRVAGGDMSGDVGAAGVVTIIGGANTSAASAQRGGIVEITGGPSTGAASYGGTVTISGGEATAAGGGDVTIGGGVGPLGNGDILFLNLRTTASSANAVWNNNGVLNIGAGGTSGGGDFLPLTGGTMIGDIVLDGVNVTGKDAAAGSNASGAVSIFRGGAGDGGPMGWGGDAILEGGWGGAGSTGGGAQVIGGDSGTTAGNGGTVSITGGASVVGVGGPVMIRSGGSTSGRGGDINIRPGESPVGNGNITLQVAGGSGPAGTIALIGLPTVAQPVNGVWDNNGVLNIGAGGTAMLVATDAEIAAGTNNTAAVAPLGLRSQLGADAATLVTTAKTIVPGINEIYNTIAQLTGVVIYAGTYDATTSTGTYNGQGGIATGTGALPAAAAANHGAYLIVTVAGPGGGTNEPVGALAVGDWLISDGAAWAALKFGQAFAAYVAKAGDTMTGDLTINAGLTVAPPPGTGNQGASVNLTAGDTTGTAGGDVTIRVGKGASTGEMRLWGPSDSNLQLQQANGAINLGAGDVSTGSAGNLTIAAGSGKVVGGAGGTVTINGGFTNQPSSTDSGGGVNITGGGGAAGFGGAVNLAGGLSNSADGGSISLRGGTGVTGGSITLNVATGTTTPGNVLMVGLLTTAPGPGDAIWNNNGVLNIGAGGTSGGGISEAPDDTFSYGRMGDGAGAFTWEQVMPLTGGNLIGPVTTTSTLTLFADPVLALEAVTKQYADNIPIMDGGTY